MIQEQMATPIETTPKAGMTTTGFNNLNVKIVYLAMPETFLQNVFGMGGVMRQMESYQYIVICHFGKLP